MASAKGRYIILFFILYVCMYVCVSCTHTCFYFDVKINIISSYSLEVWSYCKCVLLLEQGAINSHQLHVTTYMCIWCKERDLLFHIHTLKSMYVSLELEWVALWPWLTCTNYFWIWWFRSVWRVSMSLFMDNGWRVARRNYRLSQWI